MTTNIRPIDMLILDSLFEMSGGYVLNFSNKTFAEFFAGELNIDIDQPAYSRDGTSKGRRLKCFLQSVNKETVVRTLNALWEYREAMRARFGNEEKVVNAHGQFLQVIDRIRGVASQEQKNAPEPATNRPAIKQLSADLLTLSGMASQARGYEFEKFLKRCFDLFGMRARDAFRLQGEQIDGSFLLADQTYLLEAKWHNAPTGVSDLHNFHGKVEQKAEWSRGLFVSYAGFTSDGISAFGKRKRIICMDGHDIYEALDREIPLSHVLGEKVRRAAETGAVFSRVRDLFPV
ncbi:restriction endonuclease [Tardiphaga sp. 841_E9_N1_2]|uniref:restriction endonuclease n=1 Tax=Tardiphaga sp. 841_E9_N1_2 TaxID=3240762 RepID=UPI003F256C45